MGSDSDEDQAFGISQQRDPGSGRETCSLLWSCSKSALEPSIAKQGQTFHPTVTLMLGTSSAQTKQDLGWYVTVTQVRIHPRVYAEIMKHTHLRRQCRYSENQIQLHRNVRIRLQRGRICEIMIVGLEHCGSMDHGVEWSPLLKKDVNQLIRYQSRWRFGRLIMRLENLRGQRRQCFGGHRG